MDVRPLRQEDRPRLRTILTRSEVFSDEEIQVAVQMMGLAVDVPAAGGYLFAVAVQDGETVGYACYGPASFSTSAWDLYWIAVSPDRQRRGIGTALLQVVDAAAADAQASMLLVETASQPAYGPARQFYAAHGYTELARLPDFYSRGDDKLIYAKLLRGAATDARVPAAGVAIGASPERGRGVFAQRAFAVGETIERAPVLVFPAQDWDHIVETALDDYCFRWGESDECGAVGLGCASLYNHSFSPNARYALRLSDREIEFQAIRLIAPGEEILINYNRHPDDHRPVWFEPR